MLLEGFMLSVCWEFPRESAKKLLLIAKLFCLLISYYYRSYGLKDVWTLTSVHHLKHEDVPLIFLKTRKFWNTFDVYIALFFLIVKNI